ncbi:MAG: hypothetical protein E6147_03395 [Peptostreptococcus sp.]|uniref:hypothetical protein n=1 Tax=Peptostreptococcus sp. TaxID=1262 RepID=UPI002914C819|nr:hypothetical protein [Peptostreptococcus sp.]MDU5350020.1 hypothetical protein [Peptostreptococcus sp.]MDU5891510.1 hypothetical protein [Peptostreptococcus sp.]
MNKDLKSLALDIYTKKVQTFSTEDGSKIDANDALRKLFDEKTGGDRSPRAFNKIKDEFFEILEVLVTEGTSSITREVFSPIMEFKDTSYGEKPKFVTNNPELFDVSVIAASNDNIRRQRLFNGEVPTTPFDLGLAVYTEYDAFMLGKIDLNNLVDRVVASFNKRIAELIGETFAKGYDSITVDELKVTHSNVEEGKLLELCEKVGNGAVIYGTKIALSKIPGIENFAVDSTDIRNGGFVTKFKGVKCVQLENVYNKDTKKFAIANDTLFVIPEGDKILYGGFEGEAWINDNLDNGHRRLDRQLELSYARKFHLGIAVANRYGAYKIQ